MQEFYDANFDFQSCRILTGFFQLKIYTVVNRKGYPYCQTKEYGRLKGVHYTIVLRLSTVGTIPLRSLVILSLRKQPTVRHQLHLREAVVSNNTFCNTPWADFVTVIFVNPFKECQKSTQVGKNYQGGLFTTLVADKFKQLLYLLTTVLHFPYSTLGIFYGIYRTNYLFDPPKHKATQCIIVFCIGGSKTKAVLYQPIKC